VLKKIDIHPFSFCDIDIRHHDLIKNTGAHYINDRFTGHGLIVGWVEHPDIFCWVSFLNPTYVPTIFLLSAKPNKMAEDRTVPQIFYY